ncbi:uncharacterized protein GGS22DRAFT_151278 [Annulohypoxylon maeteangense]|uniref:uncharacterized protein n=1 Tax=Annulohypoxylon maeteangense TaxID=1927788 RepID=UPI002008375C|nr:uncharacterized protein GGS22DRAFT_151278 [Annulohypoxylon maeteangense]KAI0890578.1 hypothetical protein GGS22DRAFT_151278 [Annulohypoxylon maeteangense]
MAFLVFESSLDGAYFTLVLIFMPLCIVVTGLRFLATKRSGRKPGMEDWFALLALASYLVGSIITEITLPIINGENQLVMAVQDPERFAHFRKLTYTNIMFFPIQMFFSKLSIMTLYYRIFGVNRTYARCIYALGIIHVVWVIWTILFGALECNPVRKFWMPFIDGKCLPSGIIAVPTETVNSLLDFALVFLAMHMIQSINMTRATKWKLRALFGVGAIVGIIGFIKIGIQYTTSSLYIFTSLGIWANIQMTAAIICCCAPVYKPILPETGFWNRLASRISISRLRSNRGSSRGSSTKSQRHKNDSQPEGWAQLDESSMKGLAWPEPHLAETYALSDYGQGGTIESNHPRGTIKVQRSVDVV